MGVDKGGKGDLRQRRALQRLSQDPFGVLGITEGDGIVFGVDPSSISILLATISGLDFDPADGGLRIASGDRGDITVSGGGVVWTIDPDVVTFAKMQNSSAASVLVGRGSAAGAGDFQEITLGAGLTMTGTVLSTSVVGVTDGDKGDITVSGSGTIWTIDPDVVTFAKMQNSSAASRLVGRGSAAGAGDFEEITLGTGLTMTGTVLSSSATATPAGTNTQVQFNNSGVFGADSGLLYLLAQNRLIVNSADPGFGHLVVGSSALGEYQLVIRDSAGNFAMTTGENGTTGAPTILLGDSDGSYGGCAITIFDMGTPAVQVSVPLGTCKIGDTLHGFGNSTAFVVDDALQKTTSNVKHIGTKYVAVDAAAEGFILKDTQATPHYWRVTVSNTGVLTTTDIGTTLP